MTHDPQAWTALQQARAAWSAQRASTIQKLQDAATAEQFWEALAASLAASDVRVTTARSAYDVASGALPGARGSERLARAAVATSLGTWLDADPATDVRTMSAAYPIALFPCRLETRFDPPTAPTALKVRIYPDDIQSDSHEPELTAAEGQAGDTYWSSTSGGLDPAEAWRRLLLSFPAPRAAYLVHATDPKGTRPSARPSSWTRPAETRLLPDRWIVTAYRGGEELYRGLTKPVVEPLALTVSPLMGVSGDASTLGADPDLGWAADFQRALDAGMAVTIPLSADDAQAGFDRVVALGVKASLAPADAAAQLGDLWRDHSYSRGVAFVAQGSPTNNTNDAPAAYPPDDPNGAVSYALHFTTAAPAAATDGKVFMDALGLPADLAAPVAGAGGTEQEGAHNMNIVLWSPTWGYYLRELMATGFDALRGVSVPGPFTASIIAAARDHFLGYVRGRGPFPAFRVGTTPYGLLPATSLRHWTGFGSAPVSALDLVTVQVWPAAGANPGRDEVRIGRAVHSPSNGLYTVFEGGTPVPFTNSACAFAVPEWGSGRQPDLYILHKSGTASGKLEYTVLSARSGYCYVAAHGATSLGPTDSSYAFAVADWDGDGKPDLFVVHRLVTATDISILSGASGFQKSLLQGPISLPNTVGNWSFALADWDHDGRPDLFAVQTGGAKSRNVEVHVLSGASKFQTEILHTDTRVAEAPDYDVSVADWDGDGVVDLVLARRNQPGANNLAVTVAPGSRQFQAALPVIQANLSDLDPPVGVHPLNPNPAFVMAADWDGDGRAELLAVLNDGSFGAGGMGVTVFSASPVMQFAPPTRLVDSTRGTRRTVASTALDIFGTGSTDLVLLQAALQSGTNVISYRIARGLDPDGVPARFAPDDPLLAGPAVTSGLLGTGVAVADLDGDKLPELIVYHHEIGAIGYPGSYRVGWKLDANGNVSSWSADVAIPGPTSVRGRPQYLGGSMALADLDGSGKPDMIVLLAEQLQFPLRLPPTLYYVVGRNLDATGQVSGGWSNGVEVPLTLPAGSSLGVAGISVGDIDKDGRPDVVVAYVETASSGATTWFRIGWQLDASGNPQGGWSDPYRLPDTGAASIAGIALACVSRGGWTGILRGLVDRFRRGATFVPRMGTSLDPETDLLNVMALDASARQVGIRQVLGPNALLNLYTYLGTQAFFQPIGSDWTTWYRRVQRRARTLFEALGDPAWNPATNAVQWDPRMADAVFANQAAIFNQPLAAPKPLSETAGLPTFRSGINYLAWLASLPPVLNGAGPSLDAADTDIRAPLLYYLARHGLLTEYASAAFQIDVSQGGSSAADDQDPELVGVVRSARVRTVWNRLLSTKSGFAGNVGQFLFDNRGVFSKALTEYLEAMIFLSKQPTAELDRLASETLDACSHRVDCWVTSLAARRLQREMRPTVHAGLYVGGYGWLENVVPSAGALYTSQTVNGQPVLVPRFGGGYIHAPSPALATTAAVLRNAYMNRGGAGSTACAIDLSSERARIGRDVLEAVRQGVSPGAVLGYRVERILDSVGLQRYIDPFRDLFPLVSLQVPASGAPSGSTAARTVVDGLQLRAAWPNLPAGSPWTSRNWGLGGLPNLMADLPVLQQALNAELGLAGQGSPSWADPMDAVADLLTTEAVYQTVRGNKTGAAAALDALSQGTRAPDPEFLRQPRHGVGVTHRVAFLLGDPAPALAGWPVATPRAEADPDLDGWVGSLLGDPARVICHASVTTGKPPVKTDLGQITLAGLGLRPLDVLELARTSSTPAGASELDRRIAWTALNLPTAPAGSSEGQLTIAYVRDASWSAAVRSFPEILELARSINAMLGRARPLDPSDLLAPESKALAATALPALSDAQSRAQTASANFDVQVAALQAAATTASPSAGALRTALVALSFYSLPASIPSPATGTDPASAQALLSQASNVLVTAQARQKDVHAAIAKMGTDSGWNAVADARAAVQALLGRDLPFLAAFTPVEAHPGELTQAMSAQPTLIATGKLPADEIVRRWLMGASRVRPSLDLWRRMSLYSTALGSAAASWTVAQLPYRPGDAWVGLPFPADSGPPRAGLVSLVFNRTAAPAAGGLWNGLMLDEWTEIIPSATTTTAVGLHYRSPAAQAPQAVLLAVPPTLGGAWDLETLLAIVKETQDLAHVRAVDASLAGSLGQFLPAALIAYNVLRDTVSTDFRFVESAE
jgi:hypothetical protein